MASRPPEKIKLWEALSPPTQPGDAKTKKEPWVISEQVIQISPTILSILSDPARSIPVRFVIDLSARPELEVEITSRNKGALNSTIVQGRVDGTPPGDLLLAVKGDTVAGTVRIGTQLWKIERLGDGRHRLIEINPEKFPPD
jgi:hypothetical protein